jgi:hypothetical protein
MTFGIGTLFIIKLVLKKFNLIAFSIMAFSKIALSIMAFSKIALIVKIMTAAVRYSARHHSVN